MTEPCKYEAEIAVMSKGIKDLKEDQSAKFGKLFKILEGNGGVGIVTQTELNKASIHRLWWTVPCMITLFGIIIGVVTYF